MRFIEYLKKRDIKMYESFEKFFGFNPNDKNKLDKFKDNIEKKLGNINVLNPNNNNNQNNNNNKIIKNKPPQGVSTQDWQKTLQFLSPSGKLDDIGSNNIPNINNIINQGVKQGNIPANTIKQLNKKAPWLKIDYPQNNQNNNKLNNQ